MTYLVVPGDVVRVAVRQIGGEGQDIVNVFHLKASGTGSVSASIILTALANYFDTVYTTLNASTPNTQNPLDLKADVVALVGGIWRIVQTLGTTTWGSTYNPAAGGDYYAAGVCALIILRTLVGKVFGRKFLGMLTEAAVGNYGTMTPTTLTAIGNWVTALLAGFVESTLTFTPGVPSTRTLNFEPFTVGQASVEAGYQRRRSVRMGS